MRFQENGILQALWRGLRTPVLPVRHRFLQFGWVLLMLFCAQVVTGTMLSIYYEPSPELAAESVRYIMRDVGWGWLVRGTHYWSAQGMILLCLAQLLRTFLLGSYRGVRAANWHLGLLLLACVLLFAFTGEILRLDERAFGMVLAALGQVESIPLGGPGLAQLWRGGEDVTAATLSRTFSTHALLLPWISSILVVLSLWFYARRRPKDS